MKEILLSINPPYVEKILSGAKKVEYRRWTPKCDLPFKVHVYSTDPIRKVVATFIVKSILENTPQQLWESTKDIGGIEEQSFFSYFENRKVAYAWEICELIQFDSPLLLSSYKVLTPPQKFRYVP